MPPFPEHYHGGLGYASDFALKKARKGFREPKTGKHRDQRKRK